MTLLLLAAAVAASPPAWRELQPGVAYATFATGGHPLHVVRIDPARARLAAVMSSAGDGQPRTAGGWCKARGLAVAINLGMYRDDHRTNVGHARAGGHVNNPRWVGRYHSALAFAPARVGAPPALMVDLDQPGARERLAGYTAVVQNLRLIRAPGRGVWAAQERRWSEAAVAVDREGRLLFLFSRQPHAMKEWNDRLLALPLGVAAAMHVEGGPEASLSIHAGGVDLDLNGSYETGFNENDDQRAQWPIPNVLGVARAPGDSGDWR